VYRQITEQFEVWHAEGGNWEMRKRKEALQREITQIDLKQTITSVDYSLLQALWIS
jgi:hypothetical protein